MRGVRDRAALFLLLVLLWSVQARAIQIGQPLSQALEELRRAGLQLVFSSALVEPSLKVTVDPGTGSPETVARRILEPHGLTLDSIRPGLFAIVRHEAGEPAARSAKPDQPLPQPPLVGPLLEVDVYASRYAVDSQRLSAVAELTREDLAARPGLDQDALRVTRYMPGTASNSLSARTHVRGGRDDEVAVYFDGVQLFEPFHYKDVQSFLGILDPATISTVDFFSGVFPARFGNRLSGVLDIRPRVWTGENYHELGASVLYSHALSQGRLESRPVEWLAAVRRSNVELIARAQERPPLEPDFLDALGRVQIDIGERSKVALGWLLLDDNLRADLTDSGEQADIGYRDATGWIGWQFKPNEALETRASVALTDRHTNRNGVLSRAQNVQGMLDDRRRFDTTAFRLESGMRLSDRLHVEAGAEYYEHDAQYNYRDAATFDPQFAAALGRPRSIARNTDVSIDGHAYAAYVSALTFLTKDVHLDTGLRWDGQRYGTEFNDEQLSPQVTLQYRHDPDTVLRLSWRSFAQAQRPDELQVQDGDTTFDPTQRARQTVVSLERNVWGYGLLRTEIFDKHVSSPKPTYENLLDPFALLPELEVDRVRVAPDRSRAYGAEISMRWDLPSAWSTWASYSLSRANDYFDGDAVPRTWDQKHSLNAGVSWTQRAWILSANTTWHTGWRRNSLLLVGDSLALSPRNESAWRDYFSLDLRAAWNRKIPRGALQAFLEVDNVTNHGNLCCVNYELADTASGPLLNAESSAWLPRFALFGLTWQLP
jgi:TonB dependent receptor/TonB-dependent Receptor Plug Domain